jgi:hypothetical protein
VKDTVGYATTNYVYIAKDGSTPLTVSRTALYIVTFSILKPRRVYKAQLYASRLFEACNSCLSVHKSRGNEELLCIRFVIVMLTSHFETFPRYSLSIDEMKTEIWIMRGTWLTKSLMSWA